MQPNRPLVDQSKQVHSHGILRQRQILSGTHNQTKRARAPRRSAFVRKTDLFRPDFLITTAMWPTPEKIRETFDGHIKAGDYGTALTFANLPGITEECLRATIAYLLTIANNIEQEQKTRLNAFLVARSLFWQRESFKNDAKLSDDLFKSEFALHAPLWAYI